MKSSNKTPDADKPAAFENQIDSFCGEKEDYRILFDSLLYGIQEIDTSGTIVYANEADHRIHGFAKGELIGKSIFDFYESEADRQNLAQYLEHLIEKQPEPTPWFHRDVRKDGSFADVKVDWNYKRDQNGKVVGFISLITDISENRRLQQDLQENKTKFQSIFEHSPLALMYTNAEGTIINCNDNATKLFGAPRNALIGFSYKSIKDKRMRNALALALAGQKSEFQGEYLTVTGNVLTQMKANFSPSFNDNGMLTGVIGIFEDISDRMQAEKALKESEEKYSKLFNNEIDAIIIVDVETQEIIDANTAFLKVYGYTRDEAKLLKARDISAEPDKTTATIEQTAREENMRISRRKHKKKDGTVIIVDIAAAAFTLRNRKVIFARIRNITEHVEAEKKLHELEERFRIAFLTSPDAININKMDGTFVEINKGFTDLTGYRRKDVIGRSSLDISIWTDPEVRKILLERLQKDGRVNNLEAGFRIKDGSKKIGLMSANIIHLKGEPHILSITRDITARKNAETEKAKLEAQLRQVYKMEAIGTMAGGIAHDFNNILAIIVGNADLAKFVIKEDGPVRQYIDKILEASSRAKEMVRQILAFSRQVKQNQVPVKPHLVFNETLNLLRATIPTTIDIQQDLDPQCGTIKADPTQLNQLLMNFCANAVHAMDEKGTLRISLHEVELNEEETLHKKNMRPGPYALLTVTDTGRGMSPEVKERIFDPFFTTKKIGDGTGMGLSVVHGIVENHGGMITVDSAMNEGATFKVYFPIVDNSAVLINDRGPLLYKGKEHILFVDDEEPLVEMAVEMLQLYGYKVTSRTSSIRALSTFKDNPDSFDLVITDQTMPNLSGSELSAELLKIRPSIPIILCTGYSSKISDKIAKEIGIADYFLKPFDTEKLLRSVRKVLDKRK